MIDWIKSLFNREPKFVREVLPVKEHILKVVNGMEVFVDQKGNFKGFKPQDKEET
jgi:hypothetical protein